jgi:hypothetical protein
LTGSIAVVLDDHHGIRGGFEQQAKVLLCLCVFNETGDPYRAGRTHYVHSDPARVPLDYLKGIHRQLRAFCGSGG